MRNQAPLVSGMGVFILIWLGQLISRSGSGLTSFALDIWVYQKTGSVTQLALLTLVITLPFVILAPVAGAVADRWNRRWIMVISNLSAGGCILAIALLYSFDRLHIWHIYLAVTGASIADLFRGTAFRASLVLMVPKEKLLTASSLTQVSNSIVRLVSPALGGLLLSILRLKGIILLDFATICFALLPLLLLRLPELADSDEAMATAQKLSVLEQVLEGWRYLTDRRGLLGLVLLRAVYNVAVAAALMLATPLLLSLTTPTKVGVVLSISASGMFLGSLLLNALGDRQQQLVNIIFASMILGASGLIGAGIRPSLSLFTCASFCFALGIPLIQGCTQVLFQRKVAPQVQGRIFAANSMVITAAPPLAALAIGPLVDHFLEPQMAFDGPWSHALIGQLIGSGPGRGIALLFMMVGAAIWICAATAYQYEPLRLLEKQLPDQLDPSS